MIRDIKSNVPSGVFINGIVEWSDDCEANIGNKKSGSIWIKIITFLKPSHSPECLHNTYHIAIGPKNSSHEIVEERFRQDLEDLKVTTGKNLWFFLKTYGHNIQIHTEFIVSLNDQPERRSGNHLILGNSIYGPRWVYSCNFKAIKDILPSCKYFHSYNLKVKG